MRGFVRHVSPTVSPSIGHARVKSAFMVLHLWLYVCGSEHGVGQGMNGVWMPPPTRSQRYSDPASLIFLGWFVISSLCFTIFYFASKISCTFSTDPFLVNLRFAIGHCIPFLGADSDQFGYFTFLRTEINKMKFFALVVLLALGMNELMVNNMDFIVKECVQLNAAPTNPLLPEFRT